MMSFSINLPTPEEDKANQVVLASGFIISYDGGPAYRVTIRAHPDGYEVSTSVISRFSAKFIVQEFGMNDIRFFSQQKKAVKYFHKLCKKIIPFLVPDI